MRPLLAAAVFPLLLAACAGVAVAPGPTATPSPTATPTVTSTPTPTATPALMEPDELSPLTLADIFPPRDLSALPLDPSRLRTLVATGDVMPGRYVDIVIRSRGDDFLYPLAASRETLAAADLTVVNLEAPLIADCPPHESGFVLCGRPGFAEALKAAGVDVATLENNHIGNYGRRGIAETVEHLERAGIAWADRSTPAVLEVRGLRFGFLAFNGVGGRFDHDGMAQAIRALRPRVEVLIVALHWGAEYVRIPQPAPGIAEDDPVEVAHRAIDAGADLVIGNHPHWVQAVEIYRGKLIAYSHGNFIFDQMWSHETRVGVMGRYTFYDEVLAGVEFIPVLIEDYAQPRPLEGEEAQAVLDDMREASLELAGRLSASPSGP